MTRAPTFDAALDHQRVDADEWDGIYVVGDVHGCLREFETLLARLDVTEDDLVVVVGDLVRKGPDNHGVVDLVRESPNILSVRGNNEEKILRGEKNPDDLTEADKAFIASLPVAISWEDALVTHAGVDPRKPLEEHTVDELQNVRSLVEWGGYERPLWFDDWAGPYTVFFGHTPLSAPIVRANAVGLDTGCVYGNALTAYDWRAADVVQIVTDRTVQERKASKFVRPRHPVPTA